MTKRPDQHNIDPEEAGTTDHKFHADENDPDQDPTTEDADKPAPPPTPQELLEQQRKQAEAAREEEIERAKENLE